MPTNTRLRNLDYKIPMEAEEVGSFFLFECPCNSTNTLYGVSYLFGPSILLLFGGIWLQSGYWQLVTGLLSRKRIRFTNLKEAHSRSEPCEKFCIFFKTLCRCVFKGRGQKLLKSYFYRKLPTKITV